MFIVGVFEHICSMEESDISVFHLIWIYSCHLSRWSKTHSQFQIHHCKANKAFRQFKVKPIFCPGEHVDLLEHPVFVHSSCEGIKEQRLTESRTGHTTLSRMVARFTLNPEEQGK